MCFWHGKQNALIASFDVTNLTSDPFFATSRTKFQCFFVPFDSNKGFPNGSHPIKSGLELFSSSITFVILMRNSSGTLVRVYLMLFVDSAWYDRIWSHRLCDPIRCMNGRISQPYNLVNLNVQWAATVDFMTLLSTYYFYLDCIIFLLYYNY
jgi:hypothetical protein